MSESPRARDWDALLEPPSVGQQIAELKRRRMRKRISIAERVVGAVIIILSVGYWFGWIGQVITAPWPWSLLLVVLWVAAGFALLGGEVVILQRLRRLLVPSRFRELELED